MRSTKLKEAQIKYKANNIERVREINRQSKRRNYETHGREQQKLYYYKNRNYNNIDNMGKQIAMLFNEI